jgi:hypothetical protein
LSIDHFIPHSGTSENCCRSTLPISIPQKLPETWVVSVIEQR